MTDVNYRDLTSKWWVQAATPVINKRPNNKKIIDAIFNAANIMGVNTDGLKEYLKQLAPRKSKIVDKNISYYDNSYKYANERLTAVSSGKFLKNFFFLSCFNTRSVQLLRILWVRPTTRFSPMPSETSQKSPEGLLFTQPASFPGSLAQNLPML